MTARSSIARLTAHSSIGPVCQNRESECSAIRASHNRLLDALKALLRFNEELCADINVSKHYPSAEKARAAIAAAEGLS
jgi:hypothetical protein